MYLPTSLGNICSNYMAPLLLWALQQHKPTSFAGTTARDVFLDQLKHHLSRAQQIMKSQTNKHMRDLTLQIGDNVLVKLQTCRKNFVALKENQRFGMRYVRPFLVIAKIGAVSYKLQLSKSVNGQNIPVFHISQFKPINGAESTPYMPLPLLTSEIGPILLSQKQSLTVGLYKKGLNVFLKYWLNGWTVTFLRPLGRTQRTFPIKLGYNILQVSCTHVCIRWVTVQFDWSVKEYLILSFSIVQEFKNKEIMTN